MQTLRTILASEGLLRRIEMRIPYESPDGSPVDSRWVMDLGPQGMFADKLDLRPEVRAILKKCLREQRRPSPKLDGVMVFEDVPEYIKEELQRGADWYGIGHNLTVRAASAATSDKPVFKQLEKAHKT